MWVQRSIILRTKLKIIHMKSFYIYGSRIATTYLTMFPSCICSRNHSIYMVLDVLVFLSSCYRRIFLQSNCLIGNFITTHHMISSFTILIILRFFLQINMNQIEWIGDVCNRYRYKSSLMLTAPMKEATWGDVTEGENMLVTGSNLPF